MKKKKMEDTKIQEMCAENYTDSGGGTPPPVPPHTPEMFTNDSDSNTSKMREYQDIIDNDERIISLSYHCMAMPHLYKIYYTSELILYKIVMPLKEI